MATGEEPKNEDRNEAPIDELVRLLNLTPNAADGFESEPVPGAGRLFGGTVAGMGVVAAGRTVPVGRHLHSLHLYFLKGGVHEVPIHFEVDRIRDGRSFTTRRVVAMQQGEAILNLSASFVVHEEGISHASAAPSAPGPDGLVDLDELRSRHLGPSAFRHTHPVEVRICDPNREGRETPPPGLRLMWMRTRGALPEDPLLHAATLVYATDRTLLSTAARIHGLAPGQFFGASLDHAVWLHDAPRFDDWVLYAAQSPIARHSRGLIHAAMYRADGIQIASVSQEGLVRRPREG